MIQPIPKIPARSSRSSNSRRGKTAIITASPYKNDLENSQSIKPVKRSVFENKTVAKLWKNVPHVPKMMLMCSAYIIVVTYTQQIQMEKNESNAQLVKICCMSYVVMLKIGKNISVITVKNKLPIVYYIIFSF